MNSGEIHSGRLSLSKAGGAALIGELFEEVDREYHRGGHFDNPVERIFNAAQGLIAHVAKRYCRLDPMMEFEDLVQEAYFAVVTALNKFALEGKGRAKFSTYLYFYIQKQFQRACPGKDVFVQVGDEGGPKIMPYQEFLKIKTRLKMEGRTWIMQRRLVSFQEFLEGESGKRGDYGPTEGENYWEGSQS